MKKLILGFTCVFILGCEKYSQPTIPDLDGPYPWVFQDYDIIIVNAISDVSVIKNDTICINSFNEQSFISGKILMKQNYEKTALDRRFIIGKTKWMFGSNNYHLFCDFKQNQTISGLAPTHEPFWVSLYVLSNRMHIQNTQTGGKTVFTYDLNNFGKTPPTKMTLLSPPIVTDIYHSNGSREKAVTVQILLRFIRN